MQGSKILCRALEIFRAWEFAELKHAGGASAALDCTVFGTTGPGAPPPASGLGGGWAPAFLFFLVFSLTSLLSPLAESGAAGAGFGVAVSTSSSSSSRATVRAAPRPKVPTDIAALMAEAVSPSTGVPSAIVVIVPEEAHFVSELLEAQRYWKCAALLGASGCLLQSPCRVFCLMTASTVSSSPPKSCSSCSSHWNSAFHASASAEGAVQCIANQLAYCWMEVGRGGGGWPPASHAVF